MAINIAVYFQSLLLNLMSQICFFQFLYIYIKEFLILMQQILDYNYIVGEFGLSST